MKNGAVFGKALKGTIDYMLSSPHYLVTFYSLEGPGVKGCCLRGRMTPLYPLKNFSCFKLSEIKNGVIFEKALD